jgi:hypothetical protein
MIIADHSNIALEEFGIEEVVKEELNLRNALKVTWCRE